MRSALAVAGNAKAAKATSAKMIILEMFVISFDTSQYFGKSQHC
jgi:hypothetical protein